MIVEAYGIKLKRLTAEDIEMVRIHRNSESIRNTMEYREIISPEMQKKWFDTIDNEHHNYMLIYVGETPIGLISGTQIDWETGITANGGIFIWDPAYLETVYPARAALLMTDIGFYLGMQKNYVKILRDNLKSISFNISLGYKLLPQQHDLYNQVYELTPSSYFAAAERLRKITGAHGPIKIILDNPGHPSSVQIARAFANISNQFKEKITLTATT